MAQEEVDRGKRSHITLSDIMRTTQIPLKELAQEVFNRVNEGALDTTNKDLSAALLLIAQSAAHEWQTRNRAESRPPVQHGIASEPAARASNDVNLEFSEAQLEAAMKKLTPRQHEIMNLYITEGLTSSEIAARQKLPQTIVRRTLSQAYAKLLAALAQRP